MYIEPGVHNGTELVDAHRDAPVEQRYEREQRRQAAMSCFFAIVDLCPGHTPLLAVVTRGDQKGFTAAMGAAQHGYI